MGIVQAIDGYLSEYLLMPAAVFLRNHIGGLGRFAWTGMWLVIFAFLLGIVVSLANLCCRCCRQGDQDSDMGVYFQMAVLVISAWLAWSAGPKRIIFFLIGAE